MGTRREFREAARDQRVCAVTGRGGRGWHAHHAVREQDVPAGHDPHDRRNALRLSTDVHWDSHGMHKIPLSALTDDNVEFAFEIFGAYASDYLHRRYIGEDPRVHA